MALNERTTTTLGFAGVVVTAILGAGVWLNGKLTEAGSEARLAVSDAKVSVVEIQRDVANARGEMKDLSFKVSRIEDKITNNVLRSEFEAWILRLARDNPTMKVPDLR